MARDLRFSLIDANPPKFKRLITTHLQGVGTLNLPRVWRKNQTTSHFNLHNALPTTASSHFSLAAASSSSSTSSSCVGMYLRITHTDDGEKLDVYAAHANDRATQISRVQVTSVTTLDLALTNCDDIVSDCHHSYIPILCLTFIS